MRTSDPRRATESAAGYAARLARDRAELAERVASAAARLERDRVRLERDRVRLHALERAHAEAARAVAVESGASGEYVVVNVPLRAARRAELLDPGSYLYGKGPHQSTYEHLWAALVPREGRAPTHAGNILAAATRLARRGQTRLGVAYTYATEYAAELAYVGVSANDDLRLALFPYDADADVAALNRWMDAVLRRALAAGIPASVLPLPYPPLAAAAADDDG